MNTLEKQGYSQTEYEAAITTYLKKEGKGVTLPDVVVATGLKTEWVEYTLRQLLGKYPAYLEINPKQELLYLFDLTPKPLPIYKYIAQGIGWALWAIWQVFTLAFKVWIVTMLCTYAILYALILMVVIMAITRSGDILEGVFTGIWYGLGELWNMLTGKSATKNTDKHVLSDIFSYVFGATVPKKDSHATEKLILQQIRTQAGKLVLADIVRLTGWSLRQAQTQAAYLLANYNGDVSVTEEGKIIYHFVDLVKESSEKNLPASIWEQPFEIPKMNDTDKDTHNTITALNIFNIVMSVATPIIFVFSFPETKGNIPDWILMFFTVIPLVFSVVFFSVPSLRYLFVSVQRANAKNKHKRLLVLGKIFEGFPENITLPLNAKAIGSAVNASVEEVTAILEKLSTEMNAETNATAEGIQYDFKELK